MFKSEIQNPEYKNLLLFTVFNEIRIGPTTLRKLQWKMQNEHSFEPHDVDIAVNALSHPKMFNAISKFHVSGNRHNTVILRLRPDNQELIEEWLGGVLQNHPEYSVLLF